MDNQKSLKAFRKFYSGLQKTNVGFGKVQLGVLLINPAHCVTLLTFHPLKS